METLNIYKIWVDDWLGYDTYDSAIVVARDEEVARHIHPAQRDDNLVRDTIVRLNVFDKPWYEGDVPNSEWTNPENVNVALVGTTDFFEEGTVLCASYNAG